MKTLFPKRQFGVSILALIGILAIGGFVALIGMKSLPAWTEYISVARIAKDLSHSDAPDIRAVKESFSKRAEIEYVKSIDANDLTITPAASGTGWDVKFDYEKRIELFGNASMVFSFSN